MKLNVQDLIDQGLVTKKTYTEGEYKGLSVLKYHRRVFFNNLWHVDERLSECRGTVVDEDWNVVVLPFKKVFNFNENGTTVDPEREVIIPEKVNGFVAAETMTEKYGRITSTTGTLDSDYAKLARKWIEKGKVNTMIKGITYLFEICDKSDPHIVEEEEGAYLIGIRDIDTGELWQEDELDLFAKWMGYSRGATTRVLFKDIPETKKEGFMVRCAETHEVLCKLKSKHYLSKKFFSRVGKNKLKKIYSPDFRKTVEEEYYPLQEFIVGKYDKEVWAGLSEQDRLNICEDFLNNPI